ncbi:hypothetical protein AKO1_006392 [Acrasis kona]|uniref:Cytidyltransferase-like domain-containing protein n=1 Tax=Acrasis kona TaxID=1008807 RepID=A0AAW2YJ84_9EUKA
MSRLLSCLWMCKNEEDTELHPLSPHELNDKSHIKVKGGVRKQGGNDKQECAPLDKILKNMKVVHTMPEFDELYVLVASGKYSPPHRAHIDMMENAKLHLECQTNIRGKVIGGFFSPYHDDFLASMPTDQSLKGEHRITMCKQITKDSDWLDVDVWECSQPQPPRIIDVMRHLLFHIVGAVDRFVNKIKIVFVCGSDFMFQEDFCEFADRNMSIVVVKRESYFEGVETYINKLNQRHIDIHYMKHIQTSNISSSQVRELLGNGEITDFYDKRDSMIALVPLTVCDYFIKHADDLVPRQIKNPL